VVVRRVFTGSGEPGNSHLTVTLPALAQPKAACPEVLMTFEVVKHMLKLSDRVCKQWMVDWLMLWRPCGGEEGVHWQW
jgi:hypothetical protein